MENRCITVMSPLASRLAFRSITIRARAGIRAQRGGHMATRSTNGTGKAGTRMPANLSSARVGAEETCRKVRIVQLHTGRRQVRCGVASALTSAVPEDEEKKSSGGGEVSAT
eukprot:4251429-Pyramimonas_sp.AAC.1